MNKPTFFPAEQNMDHLGVPMIYAGPRVQCLGTIGTSLDQRLAGRAIRTDGTDWRVKKLEGFIDSHDGKIGWGLDQVCRELGLGISGSYAARLFKRQIGLGVREYAKRRRLRTAAQRLKTTAHAVKEIAGDLGYRSARVFERRFKEVLYLSPTEFRRVSQ